MAVMEIRTRDLSLVATITADAGRNWRRKTAQLVVSSATIDDSSRGTKPSEAEGGASRCSKSVLRPDSILSVCPNYTAKKHLSPVAIGARHLNCRTVMGPGAGPALTAQQWGAADRARWQIAARPSSSAATLCRRGVRVRRANSSPGQPAPLSDVFGWLLRCLTVWHSIRSSLVNDSCGIHD